MLSGHFATALIANQKSEKKTLLFFLILSQLQDFLWFIFHYLGLEITNPLDAFDATIGNMSVNMTYSHDLIPQIIWLGIVYAIGHMLFKDKKIAFLGVLIILSHFILDFFSGHPHYIFGENTQQFGLGLYKTSPLLAIGIEIVFTIITLWYFFKEETLRGIERTMKNKIAIIGVFVYGIVFMLSTAYISLRTTFGIPEFNLGINTLVPTLIITYAGMLYILYKAIPQFKIK